MKGHNIFTLSSQTIVPRGSLGEGLGAPAFPLGPIPAGYRAQCRCYTKLSQVGPAQGRQSMMLQRSERSNPPLVFYWWTTGDVQAEHGTEQRFRWGL